MRLLSASRPRSARSLTADAGSLVLGTLVALVTAGVALQQPDGPSVRLLLAVALVAAVVVIVSLPVQHSLLLIALYIGLLDGYLKLSTGISAVTFLRDLLVYSVAGGLLIRHLIARRRLAWPPLAGWLFAFCVVGAVQVFNPGTAGAGAAAAGFRQQVEFVPLFALAYIALDRPGRLKAAAWVVLFIAAANGVVSLLQFNLTPEQFAGWGPGYADRVLGTSDLSIRYFVDASGSARIRPFGLGSDLGVGGVFGMFGIPAGLALLVVYRSLLVRAGILVLLAAAAVAVVTSQGRTVVLAALLTALAFLALGATGRRSVAVLVAAASFAVAGYVGYSTVAGDSASGAFSRYSDIGSVSRLKAAGSERSTVVPSFVAYLGQYPFGAGLASAGPAASVAGAKPLNAESEPNFALIEVGIPGLLVTLGLLLLMPVLLVLRIQRTVGETRLLLVGLLTPTFGLLVLGLTGPITTAPPTAPYIFVAAALISRWLFSSDDRRSRSHTRAGASAPPSAS